MKDSHLITRPWHALLVIKHLCFISRYFREVLFHDVLQFVVGNKNGEVSSCFLEAIHIYEWDTSARGK